MPNGFSFSTEIKKNEARKLEDLAYKEKNSTKRLEMQREARRLYREADSEDRGNGFNYDSSEGSWYD